MSLGRGKLGECIKVQSLLYAQRLIVPNTVVFNGQSITNGTGLGIDTQGAESLCVFMNVGAMVGASGVSTVSVAMYQNDVDNAASSTAITGASFNDISYSTTATYQYGLLVTRDLKRYVFARVNVQGSCSPTLDLAISAVLGKAADMAPATDMNVVFDV